MNPYRLKNVFEYLTSNNQLLKKKLKLGTDEIPIPPKRSDVTTIEAINRFNKANPRVDTTSLKPLSVKHSNVRQSNVNEPNEGAIQSAFDTATRDAQFEGYPAPNYEKFKSRYLKKNMKADGGRIGYKDGPKMFDVQASGTKSGKQQIQGAPDGITSDKETINAILTMDIPLTEKVNLIGDLQYGKFRDKIEYNDDEIFLDDPKSYRDRNIGLDYNRGGEGFSGSATVGDRGPAFNIRYKKSFADGGMLVKPSDDGSRPGYRGSGDREYLDQLVEEANKGFKFVKRKELQAKAGYSANTNLSTNLDTLETKFKKAFDYVMNNPDKPVVDMFDPMRQVQKLVGSNDAVGRYLKGYEPYESSKLLIKTLAAPNSKSFLRKAEGLTLGDLEFRINNNVKGDVLFAPPRQKTNETKIMDIVDRHIKQGGTKIEWVTKPEITKGGYPSYADAVFKYKGKDYDLGRLINEAKDDPNFKEFFKAQREYKTLNDKIVTHPKTGEKIRFGSLMKEVYGNTGTSTPYNVDHAKSILDEPFTSLRVLPSRINKAAGNIQQINELDITNPNLIGKYSDAGKEMQLKKIGYNYDQSINNLIEAELKLADDVLNKGRVLRKPNDIIESIRSGENYKPDFYSKDAKPGKGFEKVIPDLTPKKANILSAFCTRKALKSGTGSLACSMEEIQTNMQKQINEAAKVSKDGKIPKRFGKLAGFAKTFFGDVAIPLEYMFAAPYLAAGDIEGAKRATTAGLFGYGKVDFDKLPEGEGQRFLKHINALNSFMDNYQSKAMAENELENASDDESRFILTNRISEAAKNMRDISLDYQTYGYDGQKGLLQGKVAAQQLIRDQVQSDYDKKINKSLNTEFFKDSDKQLLESNIRYGDKENDPNQVTPITDLESYIRNKGEATAGNTNLFFDVKPYTLNRAEAYGVPDIFDQYAGGYAGVETPGFIRETGEVDMGTKDVRDAYSSLPINMASQLAALEKEEFDKGMKEYNQNKVLKNTLPFASGGIASLTDTIPPESGPTPHGLRYQYNNVKKI